MIKDFNTTIAPKDSAKTSVERAFDDEIHRAFEFDSFEEEDKVLELFEKTLYGQSFESTDQSEYMERLAERFKDYVFE
jgi:hypothetical protein